MTKARALLLTSLNGNVPANVLKDLAEAALDELQIWRETYNDFSASIPLQTEKPDCSLQIKAEKVKRQIEERKGEGL